MPAAHSLSVKYSCTAALDNLIAAIHAGGWKLKVNLKGDKYLGINLNWDYAANKFVTHHSSKSNTIF